VFFKINKERSDFLIKYFLLGIFFSLVIYPIASELMECAITWLELIKAKAQEKITQIGVRIEKHKKELEELNTEIQSEAIGFRIGETEDEEY